MEALFHGHEQDGGIYVIRNAVNGWVYLGSASHFRDRFKRHETELRLRKHFNARLQDDFLIYGADSFSFEVLAVIGDRTRLQVEREAIRGVFGDHCYNAMIDAPPSRLGTKFGQHTLEARAKMSASKRGQSVSPETRAKISEALKGKRYAPRSAEHREKLGAARRGKPLSPEHRAKLSEAHKGRRLSPEMKAKLMAANVGRKMPDHVKQMLVDAKKGKPRSAETKAKISAALRAKNTARLEAR